MEKLYTLKTFFKWLVGGCILLILPPGSAPGHISYRYHQKTLAYFSHLAPLLLFFFTKRQSQKKGHGTMPPTYAPGYMKKCTARGYMKKLSTHLP